MKERLINYFHEYDQCHTHPTTRLTHIIAIPLILFSSFTLMDLIRIWEIPGLGGRELSVAHIWFVGMLLWYTRLSMKYTVIMGLFGVGVFYVSPFVPWIASVAMFVVAWILQLLGHAIWEKNKPAFMRDHAQLYIGPIFFIAKIMGDWPEKKPAATEV